ncbi:MAG TPA: hypothetical protein VI542_05085 [Candidatus Tectomicrobia bacterium]
MKRLVQIALVSVFLLAVVSSAVAQQTLQPVYRLGNYIEVGNDVFMHIIATADMRFNTVENLDFEKRIRDQALSRSPTNTAQHETENDLFYAEMRFGADFRYRKNFTFQLLFENQSVFDGNLVDDRSNASNPGGTSVFGQAASTENPGFRVERFWARYKFEGTPVALFVGATLKKVSQAGIFGNDDPGIGIEATFGDLELSAKAYIERESQRLGLQNDNDLISYVFTAAYNARPHRFGFDVAYFRDRFSGADTAVVGCRDIGCTGQKHDSVWIDASWTGRFGPIRGLLQGNVILGTADGTTAPLSTTGVLANQEYDIFAGSVIGYVEVDLGVVRPFLLGVYGTPDGDPTDRQLRGFGDVQPQGDSTQWATDMMGHFDRSSAAGGRRDYSCPARLRGVRTDAPDGNPYAVGAGVTGNAPGSPGARAATNECYHRVSNLWNGQLGEASHVGIVTTYSSPGTVLGSVGVRTFPTRGHEITGWFTYRGMADAGLLETAFAPEIQAGVIRQIRRDLYYEIGGFWQWTLNPHFDIRLAGVAAVAGDGSRDLAHLADCDPGPARRTCQGEGTALRADARFRARF